jgi:hypothetical protein
MLFGIFQRNELLSSPETLAKLGVCVGLGAVIYTFLEGCSKNNKKQEGK